METITISTENHETYSSISNFFIDYYMTDANGEFVKVYLYLVRIMNSGKAVTVADIADHFNLTEKDICRAIKYWISKEVLRLEYNQAGTLMGITLLPLVPQKAKSELDNIAMFKQPKKVIDIAPEVEYQEVLPDTEDDDWEEEITVPNKGSYAPKVIKAKKESDEAFAQILYIIETYFKRCITSKEIQSLMYIYDQLKFAPDLLEYLIEYCVSADKKNVNYMEAVAIDWYQRGIKTVANAKEEAIDFNSLYICVLKQLGIPRRKPTQIETDYIDTWYNGYAFDKTVILEACKRAITNNPQSANFAYVNGILESWHKSNVRKLSDIDELDKKWQEGKKKITKKNQVTNNQFNNFTQTKMDDKLDMLDKLFLDDINAN